MRWRKVAIWSVIVVLLFIVGLTALFFTSPAQQFLLRRAENLADRAGVPFKAEGLQLRPLDLSAEFSHFEYDKDGITIRATNLRIDLPWNAYGADGITINSVTADNLEARIIAQKSGTAGTPGPSAPDKPLEFPLVRIGTLKLGNGSFIYETSSTRVEIPSFSMEVINGTGRIVPKAPVSIDAATQVRIPEIPIELSPDGLRYGPIHWSVTGEQSGSGTVSGSFRWAPVGGSAEFATDPFDIGVWSGIVLRGQAQYERGVFTVPEFTAVRGDGQLTGSAKLEGSAGSAALRWSDVRIDPTGVEGATGGELDLQWQALDLSDVAGTGRIELRTEKFGTAHSDVVIADGRATLDIEASAMGAEIHADVIAGWDRQLAGNFNMTHREYGTIAAEGAITGTVTSPVITAGVSGDGVTVKDVGPVRANAQVLYRDMMVLVTDVDARWENSQLRKGRLSVDLQSRAIEGATDAITLQLRDFVPDGRGEIQATAEISGSLDDPAASLKASSSGLDIGATHLDRLTAAATLRDNILRVAEVRADRNEGHLEASGAANLQTEQVTGEITVSNLQIQEIRGLSGTVDLTARVSGPYRKPDAEFQGAMSSLSYEGQEHGALRFAGTVSGAETIQAHLQSPKYNATVEGSARLTAPYAFTADVTTNQSAVQYRQYELTADGRIASEGTLAPLSIEKLRLQDLKLTGEGVDLTASGDLDSGIWAEGGADLAQLPLENIQLTGQAQFSAVVKGPLDSPQIDGTLRTTAATIRAMDMPEPARISAAVEFNRNRFEIREMQATYADAQVVIGGSGSLQGTGEFTFTAENIRPERFLTDRPLTGVAGLTGRVKVSAPRLDAIEGQATVTRLDLNVGGVEFHQTGRGEIAFADGKFSIRNFALQGPETVASAEGFVDTGTGGFQIDLRAKTELRILEGFIPRSNAAGQLDSEIAVRGTYTDPDLNGFVRIADAQIQLLEPPLLVSDMNAEIRLAGSRFEIQRAAGDVNGGSFTMTGGGGIGAAGMSNAAIQATLMGTQLEYPQGLQSEIAARLSLNGNSPNLILSGNVRVLDALYRQNIDWRKEVFSRLTPAERSRAAQNGAMAGTINLDITVETAGPVAVSNNVANVDLIGSFRVRGTIADPVVLGRASALEGGEVYFGAEGAEATALGERRDRYIVERGTVDFNNPLKTDPAIDFEATHELQVKGERYLIRLRASGTPADLRTELSSNPYLAEPDIIAMLLTGRSFADLQNAHLDIARDQLLNYLSGQLTNRFFQNAGAALGLDTVTIEPVTIASEADVSARLTVGKDITRDLSLIYSQNLAGARNQAWIVNYSTFRDFVVRGINRADQDQLRIELRHGLEFGGGPALPRRVTPQEEARLRSVVFNGSTFSTKQLDERVAKVGAPYNVYRMNDDVRALRTFLSSQGYPAARVRARRTVTAGMADVTFTVTQGPMMRFEYRGAPVPGSVQKTVAQTWETGFVEASSLQESVQALLQHFRDEGYLQAAVTASETAQKPDERHYVFEIEPGTKFENPEWRFMGGDSLDITTGTGAAMQNPEAVRQQIEFELRSKGFLDATSSAPELVLPRAGVPHFAVTVNRGLAYMVSAIHYSGNAYFTDADLGRIIKKDVPEAVPPGDKDATVPATGTDPFAPVPYSSDWESVARRRLLTQYWQQGFNDVQISSSADYRAGSGIIEITFQINEGERQRIADVHLQGDTRTALPHLRRYFKFSQGDPVDYAQINLTRKKLYDTGLFKRVDIEVTNEPQGHIATINLNDRPAWEVRYGISLTDHRELNTRDLGFSGEVTRRNIGGMGIVAGLSLKADPSLRDGRLFFSFPVFLNREVTSTAALFRSRETLADSVSNTWGLTLQQQWRLTDSYLLSYDYSFRRIGAFERDLTDDDPDINNEVVRVARFNATLSRDTRDDILNATRGALLSESLQMAPPGIGSTVNFVRNYSQYLKFRPIWRPRLTWASAYRLGLARSFGNQPLVQTDQFNAAESLRAFGRNSLVLQPGNALLVMNQELRHPLFWRFGVVGFWDMGNAYDRIGNFRILEQRHSPGFGLRIETPFAFIRADWGFNVFPKPGESRRGLSFGIGQAF